MRTTKVLLPFAIVLMFSSLAMSASLEEARRLYGSGSAEAALSEINAVLDSDATDADKAEALDFLGTIAVDKGYLAMAKQAWSRLLEEYPEYSESRDVGTKLQLVSALLKTEVAAPSEESARQETPVAPPAEQPEEIPATILETVPPVSPPAPAPVESAPAAALPESSGRVLVAARGKPFDAVIEASERVVAFLREQGVDAESATGGIPVVEDSKMVLPLLLQKGQQESVGSVLLLTADFVSMQKMVLDCYAPGGTRFWRVKVSGGTGWKGRPYSQTGITEALAERFTKKLGEKVGEPGLPVTLD